MNERRRASVAALGPWKRPAGIVLLLLLLLCLGRLAPVGSWLQGASNALRGSGPFGALCFILAYSAGALLFVPAAMFTFVAGFTFGPWYGILVAIPGIATSSFAVFLLSRTLLRPQVKRWLAHDPRYLALDGLLAKFGARTVVLLRFSPLSPFSILNFAFGLTGIPKRHYLVATCIGTIPGSVFFAHLGAITPHLGCLTEGRLPDGGRLQTLLLLMGLLLTAAVGWWLGKHAKRALASTARQADAQGTSDEQ